MKEGWESIKLQEVCKVQNGYAFDSSLFNDKGEGLPLIRIRDIKRGYTITHTAESCSNDFIVENGDIIIGMDGDFNIGEWHSGKALLNQRVCKLIPSDKIEPRLLYYYLPKALNSINDRTVYTTVKHLSSKQINDIAIPKLPLPTQQKIVSFLDAEFEKIDTLKRNAETSLQSAKDLFQSALKQLLSPKEGWEERKLIDITTKIGSGATPKGGKKIYIKDGCSLIRSMNVQYGSFKYDELAHIDEVSAKMLDGVTIQENDVLFNITGASIARCCVVPSDVLPARVNQHVSILRPTKEIEPRFLSYLLISPAHQSELLTIGEAGSTRQALTKTDMENHIVFIPNNETQKAILSRLDALSDRCRALEDNYRKTLTLCDDLKQALLKQIFK